MIPLYDDNPTRHFPWVTTAFIALNVAVFLYELSLAEPGLTALFATYAFTAAHFFANPASPEQLITLVSATFLHGGWLHLLGNMLYLWIFGNNIEDRLGSVRFVLFYFIAGAIAVLAQAAFEPGSTVPLVGASGAIAGVLGGYVVLFPRARVITLIPIIFYLELAAIPAGFVIGFWFLMQIAQGVGSIADAAGTSNVAWWAHVGGFAFGALTLAPLAIRDGAARRRRSRR